MCHIVTDAGEIELEQLDEAGGDWFASGPRGEHMGALDATVEAAADESADRAWLAAVVTAVNRERGAQRRSMLLVQRGRGTWFHTTFSENRESIARYGLDWRRMAGGGIAGSLGPEAEGVFLCCDIDSAEWFAQMGQQRGHRVDIWAVSLDAQWLIGDPGAGGGGDDTWMICSEPIAPSRLKLVPGWVGVSARG